LWRKKGERTIFLGRREMCERAGHERERKRIKWIKNVFTEATVLRILRASPAMI
jgi:hypothetical protein